MFLDQKKQESAKWSYQKHHASKIPLSRTAVHRCIDKMMQTTNFPHKKVSNNISVLPRCSAQWDVWRNSAPLSVYDPYSFIMECLDIPGNLCTKSHQWFKANNSKEKCLWSFPYQLFVLNQVRVKFQPPQKIEHCLEGTFFPMVFLHISWKYFQYANLFLLLKLLWEKQ